MVKLVNKLKKKMLKNSILIPIVCLFISHFTMAQVSLSSTNFDYSNPKEFSIGGIEVEGTKFLDHKTLIQLSTLEVGSRIMVPGDKLSKASRILWQQGLFSDVQIRVKSIQGNSIFLTLYLEERPRLSKFKFEGIKRSEIDAIRDKIKLARGKIITENVIINTKNIIASHFKEKGFLNVNTYISQVVDTITKNNVGIKYIIHNKATYPEYFLSLFNFLVILMSSRLTSRRIKFRIAFCLL